MESIENLLHTRSRALASMSVGGKAAMAGMGDWLGVSADEAARLGKGLNAAFKDVFGPTVVSKFNSMEAQEQFIMMGALGPPAVARTVLHKLSEAAMVVDSSPRLPERPACSTRPRDPTRVKLPTVFYHGLVFCSSCLCLGESAQVFGSWLEAGCDDDTCSRKLTLASSLGLSFLWSGSVLLHSFISKHALGPRVSTMGKLLHTVALHLFVGVKLTNPDFPCCKALMSVMAGGFLINAFQLSSIKWQWLLDGVQQYLLLAFYPILSHVCMRIGTGSLDSCQLTLYAVQYGASFVLPRLALALANKVRSSKTSRFVRGGLF